MTERLTRGAHSGAEAGTCLMEQVALLAGEPFSDRPRCTSPALAALAAQVNDRLSDDARDRLLPLVPHLAAASGRDPRDAWALVATCARAALAVRPDDVLATRLLARAAALAGPAGSPERDDRLVALLHAAVGVPEREPALV